MRHILLALLLATITACELVPDGDTDGSELPCICPPSLGAACVETDAGWFCAPKCEAAGDCDEHLTCYHGACVQVCAQAGPGCAPEEACVDIGQVSACAPEASP